MTKEQIKEFVESHFHIEDEELHNEIFENHGFNDYNIVEKFEI